VIAVVVMAYALVASGGAVGAQTDTSTTTTTEVPTRDQFWPAVVRGNHWFIREAQLGSNSTTDYFYGDNGDQKLLCDWNGDGVRTPGVRRGITFYLRDAVPPTGAHVDADREALNFGDPTDIPICGDWDGDGDETIGIVRNDPSGALKWIMHNSNAPREQVRSPVFLFGNAGDTPIVGDWNDDNIANPGVRRGISFFIRDENTPGFSTANFDFGNPGDVPVAGDWDRALGDTLGVFRHGTWFLRNANTAGNPALPSPYGFGQGGDVPRVFANP
jgi:hypothetical protein